MNSSGFVTLGLVLFLVGLAHLYPSFALWDQRAFFAIYRFTSSKPLFNLFRALWPLGTTPAALILLMLILILGDKSYFLTILIYVSAITVERIIKIKIKRPRPFVAIPEVAMLQPRQPSDPSFPSGDALRVWFLVIAFSNSFKLPGHWYIIALLIALLITIGRIVMGVHYPLDVIGGTGLGILFAGILLLFSTTELISLPVYF
jgi:undecaprenyl-diphosphatase